MSLLFSKGSYHTSVFLLRLPNHSIFVVATRHFAVSLVYHNLQFIIVHLPVQLLMHHELLHGCTEGDGLLSPNIQDGSAPHLYIVAVLNTLHEVIARDIFFTGLVRLVKQSVFCHADLDHIKRLFM